MLMLKIKVFYIQRLERSLWALSGQCKVVGFHYSFFLNKKILLFTSLIHQIKFLRKYVFDKWEFLKYRNKAAFFLPLTRTQTLNAHLPMSTPAILRSVPVRPLSVEHITFQITRFVKEWMQKKGKWSTNILLA